jgi:transcriptional regulator with XRE-family HTH domain
MKRRRVDSDIVKVVAENVRALRKTAGLSQEELAHQAGLDRTYISQVERMRRNVTIVVLARIAHALQTSPEKLLAGSGTPSRKR